MRRRAHLLWLLVPLAALALALAGCGDTVSLDPVAKAAGKSSAAGSEHIELSGTVESGGVSVSMSGSGAFDNARELGSLTMTVEGGGRSGTITEVMDHLKIYMASPLFGSLPGGKHWVSLDLEQAGKSVGVDLAQYTNTNPGAALDQLAKVANVFKVGRESIGGVDTTHYHATVDVTRLPNGSHLAALTGLSSYPADVWVGADGLVRQVRFSMVLHPAAAPAPTQMTITMDYSQYGDKVDVQAPPAWDALDLTKLAEQRPSSPGATG